MHIYLFYTSPTRYVATIARSLDIMKLSVLNQLYVKSAERVVRTTSNSPAPIQSNVPTVNQTTLQIRETVWCGKEKRKSTTSNILRTFHSPKLEK